MIMFGMDMEHSISIFFKHTINDIHIIKNASCIDIGMYVFRKDY